MTTIVPEEVSTVVRRQQSQPHDVCKPNVLIIVTGGTICMTYAGLSDSLKPAPLAERLREMSDLTDSSLPNFEILEWNDLIDSSDVNLEHWIRMSRDIEQNYHQYDGFVILHGTDTLAYTASALSFMLENLNKPVILTGSMLPMCHIQTDARKNLAVALMVGAYSQITEVCILFGSRLMRGNRTRKLDCSQMDAFKSPNFPPLGRVGVDVTIDDQLLLMPSKRGFRVYPNFCMNIVVVTITPGFHTSLLRHLFSSPTRPLAVILQLYGTGTAPLKESEFLDTVQMGVRQGVEIVCLTQCPAGTCSLLTYENGALLYHQGVIEGKDMTPEAAFAKLAYLMGKGYSGESLRVLMERDIRGEVTEKPVKVTGQAYLASNIPAVHRNSFATSLGSSRHSDSPLHKRLQSLTTSSNGENGHPTKQIEMLPSFDDSPPSDNATSITVTTVESSSPLNDNEGNPPATEPPSSTSTPPASDDRRYRSKSLTQLLGHLRRSAPDLHTETHPSIHTLQAELDHFGHSHFEVPDHKNHTSPNNNNNPK